MTARFKDKTSIVTGAGSGIGRATLLRFVSEGAVVLGVDVSEAGLKETIAQANKRAAQGGRASYTVADMSKEGDVKRLVAEFVAAEGRLDSLINMAGILRSTHVTETTLDQFMEVIKVNLASTFMACREALPHLEKVKGAIVNAASTSSFFGHPYMTAYAASKGAIMSFTQSLAWEYINRGVRVNAVAPGGIATGMGNHLRDHPLPGLDAGLFAHMVRPDGKTGSPDHIASVIAMLASDDGGYMTGEIVRIDGGVHA